MENNIPTPTAKNTIIGMNLYGWFVWSVIPVRNGALSNTPAISMEMLFACLLFFDITNNPKTNGIKNKTVMGSHLI